jgi:predicted small secreted protein
MLSGVLYNWCVVAAERRLCCPGPVVELVDNSVLKVRPVRKYFSIVLSLLSLTMAMPLLGACHTTAGVGEDVSAAGHAVSSEAKKLAP